MEGQLYYLALSLIRVFRRLRRPLLRRLPPFARQPVCTAEGHITPLKVFVTGIAVWSSPSHFFKNFLRLVRKECKLFPEIFADPLELVTATASTFALAFAAFASVHIESYVLAGAILLISILMPVWAIPVSLIFIYIRGRKEASADVQQYPRYASKTDQFEALHRQAMKMVLPKSAFPRVPCQ